MPTKREIAYLVGGIGVGSYVPKAIPKLKAVRAVVYMKAIFDAYMRLQKIMKEEYHRIDEAIETELAFLNMINPQLKITSNRISFEVVDSGGDRKLVFHSHKPDD